MYKGREKAEIPIIPGIEKKSKLKFVPENVVKQATC